MDNLEEQIERIMKLVLLEEEPKKYLDDAKKILELFDEIDKYYEYAKELDPLYHPFTYQLELRKDEKKEEKIDLKVFSKVNDEGYIEAPPLKGRKTLR